jgi:hypothetical protein
MLLLLPHALATLYHQTPSERITATFTISSGAPFLDTRSVPQGQLILLKFGSPHGVLSIANHADFVVYVSLIRNTYTQPVWHQLPSESDGFLAFGPYSAHVEIVAVRQTEIRYTCHYVSESASDCTEILPANSLHFISRN